MPKNKLLTLINAKILRVGVRFANPARAGPGGAGGAVRPRWGGRVAVTGGDLAGSSGEMMSGGGGKQSGGRGVAEKEAVGGRECQREEQRDCQAAGESGQPPLPPQKIDG